MREKSNRIQCAIVVTLALGFADASQAIAAAQPQPSQHHAQVAGDSVETVSVVSAFHAALERGDTLAVLALLAPDVLIMEGGDIETVSDYRSHHLAEDVAYARAIPGIHTVRQVVVRGDVAWVVSTSTVDGKIKDRRISTAGAELVILSRTDRMQPWKIRAVHWSSHRRAT